VKLSHLSHSDSFATGAVLEQDASRSRQTLRKNIKKGVFHGTETAFPQKGPQDRALFDIGEIQEHQVNFIRLHPGRIKGIANQ